MKEAARIICDIIYGITQTYFLLQERLLWIKAFSSILGRSEAGRMCIVSSIGCYHFVSQEEFKIKAIHELKTTHPFVHTFFTANNILRDLQG